MHITYDALEVIGVVAINLIFGLTIYLRNASASINILYALSVFTASAWAITNYFTNHVGSYESQLLVNKLSFTFGLLLLLSVWFLSSYFPNKSKYFSLECVVALIFLPILFLTPSTSLVVKDVTFQANKQITNIETGSLYLLYLLFVLTFMGFIILNFRKAYMNNTGRAKYQILYSALGILLALVWILLTSALIPALTNSWELSKIGSLGTVFFIGLTGYAIVRHRLFDIRLVVARSVAYALLLFVLSIFYSLGAFTLGNLLFKNKTFSFGQQLYYIAITLLLAYTFQPLRSFFQKVTDNIFYRHHYDAQALLNNLGSIMAREIELENLTSKVINELTSQMKLAKVLIVVLDNNQIFYEANTVAINHRTIGLQELATLERGIVSRDALEANTAPEIFGKYGLSVSVDLRSNNELVGYLLLGEKKSGDIFNTGDIKTLNILAHELAIAIQNAKAYTQIQNFNITLQKRIDEATAQLRDANEHLKKLDEIKNEFLSMATHQLNTPLSVIDGYLSMIIDQANIKNDIPDEDREFIRKSLHRVHLMKRLVSDFLNVSRIEAGTFAIEPEPVDMNRLVTEEVNTLGLAAKEKQVLLRYFPPKHPVPIVEVDDQKTRQAVMNLIDNAIYYAPKGDVKVFLEFDDKNITFKVVDNGIGVPEAEKSKLFQKFSRADNAKRERPSGTGVGLYLVKRVVEDQGGSIIFNSTEGQGSTFGFRLPVRVKEEDPDLKSPATLTDENSSPKLQTKQKEQAAA